MFPLLKALELRSQEIPLLFIALLLLAGGAVATYSHYKQRGIRNNNPGNLVIANINWNGKIPVSKNTDGKFEQFIDAFSGIRAMFMDVRGDIEKDGLNTIEKLLKEYAPDHENNLPAYIESISNQIYLAANAKITPQYYLPLVKALIKHENGINPYPDSLIIEAMKAA